MTRRLKQLKSFLANQLLRTPSATILIIATIIIMAFDGFSMVSEIKPIDGISN